jgi:transcriptional regulator with XRE-family HTH domain
VGARMFGDMVRAHRGRLGITQEELADRSGVSVRGLGKIEAGRISRPRPSTVRLLADAFGLSGAERDRFCAAAGPGPAPGTIGELTRRPAPAQLPPDVTGFTGRADQLRELDMLLDQGDEQPAAVVITAIAAPPVSARPPWRCAGPTGPAPGSRTDSCTSTCAATPSPRRCARSRRWPDSCTPWA